MKSPSRPTLQLVGKPEDFNQGAWRKDNLLVVTSHATLPDRCIVCNKSAHDQILEKRLFWHTPLIFPLLVFGPVGIALYCALMLLLKQSMRVALPLCSIHQRRRQMITWVGLCLIPALPIFAVVGISMSEPQFLLFGLIGSILGTLALLFSRNEVWPKKINAQHAFIRGVSSDFLDALPPWEDV